MIVIPDTATTTTYHQNMENAQNVTTTARSSLETANRRQTQVVKMHVSSRYGVYQRPPSVAILW